MYILYIFSYTAYVTSSGNELNNNFTEEMKKIWAPFVIIEKSLNWFQNTNNGFKIVQPYKWMVCTHKNL